MLRNEKVRIIDDLHDIFANAGLVVITHQNGLTVGEATELRRRMRESNATYRVVKNRLTQRAIGDTPYEGLSDLFKGQIAIAYSDDPVAAAKVAVAYAKTNDKLEILGGGMGELVLDVVLGLLARTPKEGGPPRITAPLTAQDGALYLGPVKIMRLPRITWR